MMTIKLGIYEHYKGKRYEVVGQAMHSETVEPMVIYKALYQGEFPEGTLWVRPMKMFQENVSLPDGNRVPRFRYISMVALLLLLLAGPVLAGTLSATEVERVKGFKTLLAEVDTKTLAKTIAEIERTNDPLMILQIQETIAKVYVEIVADQGITDLAKKKWLYNTVALNMANIQFRGSPGRDPVNRMITERLHKALPHGIMANPNFYVSVE